MEIERFGGSCVLITTNKNKILIDPAINSLGLKYHGANPTTELLTVPELGTGDRDRLVIDGPGEYEVNNTSIKGIAASGGSMTTPVTNYRLESNDMSVAIIGRAPMGLTDQQVEELGMVDILIVPVGGNNYTLDALEAVKLVRKIEPKIVIPTHYAEEGVHYSVEQDGVERFFNELGVTPERLEKLKLKPNALESNFVAYELTRA